MCTGIITNLRYQDPREFLKAAFRSFSIKINKVRSCLIKVNVIFSAKFIQPSKNLVEVKTFNTRNEVIDGVTDLKEWYNVNVLDKLMSKLSEFQERDSGWALAEILHLKVNINKYYPITVGSYIPLPLVISNKKPVINIKNYDEYCILYAITAALHPATANVDSASSYPHFSTVLNYQGIQFPISVHDIDKLESLNNLSLTIYKLIADDQVIPFKLSTFNAPKHIDLLLLEENSKQHFAWIKNLSRLIRSQISKRKCQHYLCRLCLNHFTNESLLQNHECKSTIKLEVPHEHEKYLEFKNFSHTNKAPFIIYADFECILADKHIPMSVAYYLHCTFDNSKSKFNLYRGEDCVQWLINQLYEIVTEIEPFFTTVVPMRELTAEQKRNFYSTTTCHICEKNFKRDDIRVHDHCHLTGNYRGAAHKSCNLNYQLIHTIPVVFHNLSGYDAHLFIKELATQIEGEIKLLPINKEKYISFTKSITGSSLKLKFIDSFRFIPDSLEKLASYLDNDKKTITKSYFSNLEQFQLVTRKGVYPYEYTDCWEELQQTSLPDISSFYSTLHDSNISTADYEHAQNIWQKFNIQNLGGYSDLYLKTDVLLLADIFENFRDFSLQIYGLDPSY